MFDIDLQIAAAMVGGSLALIIWTIASQAHEKSVVRDSLRALDDYEVDNIRDQELLNPITERALMPVLGALTGLGRRFTPVGYVDGVRHKFVLSGRPSTQAIDRFLAVRVVTVVLIPIMVYVLWFWNPLGLSGNTHLGVVL